MGFFIHLCLFSICMVCLWLYSGLWCFTKGKMKLSLRSHWALKTTTDTQTSAELFTASVFTILRPYGVNSLTSFLRVLLGLIFFKMCADLFLNSSATGNLCISWELSNLLCALARKHGRFLRLRLELMKESQLIVDGHVKKVAVYVLSLVFR